VLAFSGVALFAKSKPQNLAWQTGEVAAIDVLRIPVTPKRMRYRYTYTIHAAGHSYVFDDTAKLNLTVNGPVEYAVEADKIFVRDEGGKEHKETILQKAVDKPQ
jgi:hypothetical protein